MKVLTAQIVCWILRIASSLAYRVLTTLADWRWCVEGWAGIGDEHMPWGGTD